jgi:predicted metal-dependent phosphoesterase TrpH
MKKAANSRRALIVITDGGYNHSRHSFRELLSAARESDVQVFAITDRRNVRDFD